ncbi:MAG: GTP-binding protein [Moraxellaceae bacterium]
MSLDNIKLVLAGPVGAGKSTAINSIADSAPVSTEMPLLEGGYGEKTTTTVAMDFATINMDGEPPLFVYGLPGQEHFAFMRSIILEGALGIILLLNAADANINKECQHWLDALRASHPDIPIVIGITHADCTMSFSMGDIRAVLRSRGEMLPAFTVDARNREQMHQLVRALLSEIIA